MVRIGHLLGKYQPPMILVDTNALVKFGQHDIGALSAVSKLINRLEAESDTDPKYEFVVLKGAADEYSHMYDSCILDSEGIPKASVEMVHQFQEIEFPEQLEERIADAKKLWLAYSRRAHTTDRKGMPHFIEMADRELLAYAMEQTANNRTCFVFSYDEDIRGPVHQMSLKNPYIHIVDDAVEDPAILADAGKEHILIPRKLLGTLYGFAGSAKPDHYLLSTRAPFENVKARVAVSIHPVKGEIRLEEGDASRQFLWIYDTEEYLESKGYKTSMIENRQDKEGAHMLNGLMSRYPMSSFQVVTAVRSRKDGWLNMFNTGRQVAWASGQITRNVESADMEWFSFDENYMGRFSWQTNAHLYDFQNRFPK
ncbi:MAG: hypothetical protein HYT71_02545 [Candidatus Aenigmarchaeota archaeon]|nr:hypothetical protein [Candidatus Aenigmarchaeota archaeon]